MKKTAEKLKVLFQKARGGLASRQIILWLLAVIIGIAVGYSTVGFRKAIDIFQLAFFGTGSEKNLYSHALTLPWWQIILAPAVGGLGVGLVVHFLLPERRVHSVADVIEANALYDGRIRPRDGLLSAAVSAASLGMGASAGREGPAIHLGATLTSLIARWLKLTPDLGRTLLACGVAAAVSASFNAPIAGVFFALEVVLGHYALHAFAPVVLASVGAMWVSQSTFGEFPAFIIPAYEMGSALEYPAFVILGIVCAVVAISFLRGAEWTTGLVERTGLPVWARPAVGGFIVGVIAVFFPQILGVGYEATDLALKEQFALHLLIALIIAKSAATVITMACRFGGGVFSPALFIGAMTGGAYGIIATSIFPEYSSSHGLYAIVGMGAVAGAILGAPISTLLIVFELTRDYRITIALMIATATASLITQQITKSSFFYWQLERRGLQLKGGRGRHLLQLRQIADYVSRNYSTVELDATYNDMDNIFADTDAAVLVVTDESGRPVGIIGRADLHQAALSRDMRQLVRAADFTDKTLEALRPTSSLEAALALFERTGAERLPVVEIIDGTDKLVGIISHRDVLIANNRALWDARSEESGPF